MTRKRERGSAMLVTLIVIAALLAGAAVLVSMELASARSGDVTRTSMTALYCAEAGLTAAAPVVQQNYSQWATSLAASGSSTPVTTEPTWLYNGINNAAGTTYGHDLDGDHIDDFSVYIKDNNNDESPDDMTVDDDLRIYIVSTCTKYPGQPVQVEELIQYSGGGANSYKWQLGGGIGNGQAR